MKRNRDCCKVSRELRFIVRPMKAPAKRPSGNCETQNNYNTTKNTAHTHQHQIGASRRRCLSILRTLRDRHLDLPGNPVTSYHLKTLLLHECEKHPRESEWEDNCLADRINGIYMQLISCLQCRRCPHYFLPNMDLFRGKSPGALENAAKQVWRLLRVMLTTSRCLEEL